MTVAAEEHMGLAYSIAAPFIRSRPWERDDICSDAFEGLVEAANRFAGDGNFGVFAAPRIRGSIIDGLKSRAGRAEPLPEDIDIAGVDDVETSGIDEIRVRDILAVLDDRERDVAVLIGLEGLAATQAADRLGVSPTRVRNLLGRAGRRLAAAGVA